MSRARGLALQNALARYLQAWWPHAESAGAGRNGRDILGTPGIWWENKSSLAGTSPAAIVRQAADNGAYLSGGTLHNTLSDVPVTVYWPPGVGAKRPEYAIAMLPLPEVIRLLIEAGYAPAWKDQAS